MHESVGPLNRVTEKRANLSEVVVVVGEGQYVRQNVDTLVSRKQALEKKR